MSISSQRDTEVQRAAYAALVDLYARWAGSRDPFNNRITQGLNGAEYHSALDMYVLFTGEDAEAVHDNVVESCIARMEAKS